MYIHVCISPINIYAILIKEQMCEDSSFYNKISFTFSKAEIFKEQHTFVTRNKINLGLYGFQLYFHG